MDYQPAPAILALGDEFYDRVAPARFPALTLRFRNQRAAAQVGLHDLDDQAWERAFARFEPLADNLPAPLALRYHGHQFQTYNPALGDGRGFLFAQLRDERGRLLDLATKGSGQTPWSRGGDGRLTLKGGVREVLATELLETRGVNTSKSFSLFETHEALQRNDEPSPTRSSVLVRLGHSHLRFGTFQRLAYHRRSDALASLVAYSLAHYAPELCDLDGPAASVALLRLVVRRSASLCAEWMAAGFVHGVLNTDNMNVTGESFDYGPYRFLPRFDPLFTAAYFDHSGLYAYGNQPRAVQWNLHQLAAALASVAGEHELTREVGAFEAAFGQAFDRAICRRLGVAHRGGWHDQCLRRALFELLATDGMDFDRVFFDWQGGLVSQARAEESPLRANYRSAKGREFIACLTRYEPTAAAAHELTFEAPLSLLVDEIEAIWAAIDLEDDWRPFEAKLRAIRERRAAP